MSSDKRLPIVITEEDMRRVHKLIPWGLTSRIMRILLIQTLDLLEEHGDVVLGALLSGKITALDLLKRGGPDGSIRSS
jgi:uncharacterized protein (DUF488 family)